jgi:hypothetical protein
MIPPASPLSTLRYDPSQDHRQDSRPEWSRFSFSVGLSHPLQCAGLSRRSLVTKMTVKADEGFIVSVTMPSGMTAQHGDKVAFKATLTPSDNDPKFAFGKRPTMVAVPVAVVETDEETDDRHDHTDSENIYGLSSIQQSIEQDRRYKR